MRRQLASLDRYALCFALVFLVGAGLRLTGLTRGTADLGMPPQSGAAAEPGFYRFHPDEETVVGAALRPVDLRQPPFTVYGTLPVYLLHAVLGGAATVLDWGPLSLERPSSARAIFLTARLLAAAFSCATIWLTWRLGRTWLGQPAACVGALIVALAPGAIQQAHFYIVDGPLVLLTVASVAAGLRALQSGRLPSYAWAGALIGATSAVRLTGLLLAVWLLVCHVAAATGTGSGVWSARLARAGKALAHPGLALAGAICVSVLVAFQPYLVLTPRRLLEAYTYLDFGLAVAIARLEILQPWTLVDLGTVRYWDQWVKLMPPVAEWPLTLIFPVAVVVCAWYRTPARLALLLWCGLFFLVVGGVPAKAVRYLMPLLPFLALLTGAALVEAMGRLGPGRRRRLAAVAAGLIGAHLVWSGLAFSRIYLREDSRLQAARWVRSNLPAGATVGVERGGVSLRGVLDGQRYALVDADAVHLFYTGPYMLEQQQVRYLYDALRNAEWAVLTDVNRMRQFTAVPDLYPVAAEFFQRLLDGRLGFDLVRRFKERPGMLGIGILDDAAEPSFLGYDHPAVFVLKRQSPEAVQQAFAQWENQISADPQSLDAALAKTAAALRAGQDTEVRQLAEQILQRHPATKIAWFLAAEAAARLHAPEATAIREHCRPDYPEPLTLHLRNPSTVHLIPAAAASAMLELGLRDLALRVLREGANGSTRFSYSASLEMAAGYAVLAQRLLVQQDLAGMQEVLRQANRIQRRSVAHNALARLADLSHDHHAALHEWEGSLRISPDQPEVWAEAGILCATRLNDAGKARHYLEQAIRHAPVRRAELTAYLQGLPAPRSTTTPPTGGADRRTMR